MKILVIAEKDSLAKKIATAIGNYKKLKDHYHAEGNGFIADIYYTFGHILEADTEKTLKENGYPDNFPVFPKYLKLKVKDKRGTLFKAIKQKIEEAKQGKYDRIVNAGDPDREGETLVREVLNALRVPKEICYRIWFDSETPKELLRALKQMKPISNYDHLAVAGESRKVGDWWTGINCSIALQNKTGNRKLSLGRVQTPVLRLIVERDLEIENFKPEKYFVIKTFCEKDNIKFTAVYQNPNKERLKERQAKIIIDELKKANTLKVVSVDKQLKRKSPPTLPRLSDIQGEAGRFGFTSKKTLQIIQKLYENEILSYPRTDSRYLATNDREKVIESLRELEREDLIPKLSDSKVQKRIFNDKDVQRAGHHAIIPLKPLPENASKEEKIIYRLILNRFLVLS